MRRREEKKNTMLLTVIAVATLLVAVVGATFAYFSLSVTNNSSATTASVSTGKVGKVTIASTQNTALTLTVTGADMADPGETDVKYYAVNNTDKGTLSNATGGIWKKDDAESTVYTIATGTAEDIADNDTYTCKYKIQVAPTGFNGVTFADDGDGAKKLAAADDVVLEVKGPGIAGGSKKINFTELNSGSVDDIEGTFTFTKNALSSDISAQLYLLNDAERTQNEFAGKELSVSLTIVATDPCTITSAGAGA